MGVAQAFTGSAKPLDLIPGSRTWDKHWAYSVTCPVSEFPWNTTKRREVTSAGTEWGVTLGDKGILATHKHAQVPGTD